MITAKPARGAQSAACAAPSYPPIDSYAFPADGQSTALVGCDGAVEPPCARRFDGASVFARLLERERGGAFELFVEGAPPPELRCVDGTLVLESRFESHAADLPNSAPTRVRDSAPPANR